MPLNIMLARAAVGWKPDKTMLAPAAVRIRTLLIMDSYGEEDTSRGSAALGMDAQAAGYIRIQASKRIH